MRRGGQVAAIIPSPRQNRVVVQCPMGRTTPVLENRSTYCVQIAVRPIVRCDACRILFGKQEFDASLALFVKSLFARNHSDAVTLGVLRISAPIGSRDLLVEPRRPSSTFEIRSGDETMFQSS